MENNQNPSTEMQQIVQLMEKQTELMEKLYDTQHDHNKHVKRTHYAGLTWTIIRLGILVAIIFGAYNIFSSLNPAHILEWFQQIISDAMSGTLMDVIGR